MNVINIDFEKVQSIKKASPNIKRFRCVYESESGTNVHRLDLNLVSVAGDDEYGDDVNYGTVYQYAENFDIENLDDFNEIEKSLIYDEFIFNIFYMPGFTDNSKFSFFTFDSYCEHDTGYREYTVRKYVIKKIDLLKFFNIPFTV